MIFYIKAVFFSFAVVLSVCNVVLGEYSTKPAFCNNSEAESVIVAARNDASFWKVLVWREDLHEKMWKLENSSKTQVSKVPSFSLLAKPEAQQSIKTFNKTMNNKLVEPIHLDFLVKARTICNAEDWSIILIIRDAVRSYLGFSKSIPFYGAVGNE